MAPERPATGPGALTVVKLGGSHALEAHLHAWLAALARCGGLAVIVPGGGLFADAVRRAQPVIGFDDRAAHHMALLAMEQFGIAIASLNKTFIAATSERDILNVVGAGRVPVWLPTAMALDAPELPATWDLTSDSLAAWLARRLRARRLVLVKHAAGNDIAALAAGGGVDPLFPSFAAQACQVCVLGAGDAGRLAALLADAP